MDRQIDSVDISFFLNETATRGVILTHSTSGSGIALEDPTSVLTVNANSSGTKAVGMLLNDVVNLDLTRTPLNWHKDQAQIGSKVTVMTKGWAVTNNVTGTITNGDIAVLTSSGVVQARGTLTSWNQVANPFVGRFRSKADQDGYAKVYVDL